MSDYKAPLNDIAFVLEEHVGMAGIAALPGLEEATPDVVQAVLEGVAQLAEEVIAPLNWPGDRQGARVENRAVVEAPGFREAYWQYVEGGWNSLPFPAELGGQAMPVVLATAVLEMVQSSGIAFGLCPLLTQGATDAILAHGSEELKRTYLPKMIAGEWTGTMNLTEPQAGSDLAAVAARAEHDGGHYRIFGNKIFITLGDHGMTENVIHLVLARLPDAPPGVKGISLFLVPKFLVNADGSLGARNDVYPRSVEHKLGIHASPTCVMAFGDDGGAEGYLVGKVNEGLAAMFTMMNYMRLGVGAQGVGLSDRAYQAAVTYARDRKQGRAPGEKGVVPIIRHPDIRRTLLLMRTLTQASRAIAYYCASCLDRGNHGADAEQAGLWQARGELMTPIAKAWPTEIGQEVTSLGMQVHGGMGYVEETGVAQFYRDVRIASIYEGTNAIQAIDLVGRKLLRDGGSTVSAFVSEMREQDAPLANAGDEFTLQRQMLAKGLDEVVLCSSYLLSGDKKDPELVSAAAFNYLMLLGTVIGGWQLSRGALVAAAEIGKPGADRVFLQTQLLMAQFYAEQVMPRAFAHGAAVRTGSRTTMALAVEHF